MQFRKLRFTLFFILVFLTGCQNNAPASSPTPSSLPITATKTVTAVPLPNPTLTESPTSTATSLPQPTAVASQEIQEWKPENVLIYYAFSDEKELPPPIPYQLILYADGQMFLFQYGYKAFVEENDTYIQILTESLNNKEICSLLNTIDQVGFFDYDTSTYDLSENNQEGLVTHYIQVNSWQSKSVELYGLGFAINEEFNQSGIDESMVNTYKLISNYPTDEFEVYQPEKLAVWAVPLPNWNGKTYDWSIQSPSLADIAQSEDNELLYIYSNPGESTILEDEAAKVIYDAFDQSIVEWGLPFSENGFTYLVLAIPLLPYQSAPPEGEFYAPIPSPEFPAPGFSLTCHSSDGIVEIPN